MKKALIITEVFPPAFNPRMGYLVKYLPELGWDADVITINTLKENNYRFLLGNNKIIRVNLKNSDTPHGLAQKVWRFINLKRHFKNKKRPFTKGIKLNFKNETYSIVLVSVSWELYILDAGLKISKERGIPLLIDLRDIIEQKPVINKHIAGFKEKIDDSVTRSFEKMKIMLRNNALRKAKTVTTVSPYHVKTLSLYNNNVNLIYNGFDSEMYNSVTPEKTDVFIIVYTGIVFGEAEQDPTLLFKAIKELEEDGVINNKQLGIHFYTPLNFRENIKDNEHYQAISKFVEFFDYVDSSEIPGLLKRSSIALILANLSDINGPKGVITTKLFDYLGAERPVICVRSDEDILESVISELNIGISAKNVDEVYSYILNKWNEWREKGYTTVDINHKYKKQFDRKYQAKQFVDLFKKAIQND